MSAAPFSQRSHRKLRSFPDNCSIDEDGERDLPRLYDGRTWNVWSFDGGHGLWAIVAGDLSEHQAKTLAEEYARRASEHHAVAMGYVALADGEFPAGWGDDWSPA